MVMLTNTLTGKKEPLVVVRLGVVNLYVCGITPYDYAHIGHGRCYVTFDLLIRVLQDAGYHVKYCRNFTDIDDKIIARAARELGDPRRYPEIAEKFIAAYHADMRALGCKSPDVEPRVTETIPTIIQAVQELIDRGYAYEIDGDVYYRVRRCARYGALSKRDLDDLRAGARVEVDVRKEDPLDFALWKSEPTGEFWKSPWGWGRPGWHIECSVMARSCLGESIDIHGGGADLLFPHHENEIAQSEGLSGKQFAQIWMHNAFVKLGSEKMSKSLGNVINLRDLCTQYPARIIRYYFLTHHYRSPLDFSPDLLDAVVRGYESLCAVLCDTEESSVLSPDSTLSEDILEQLRAALRDDLNTPRFFAIIFEHRNALKKNSLLRQAIKAFVEQVTGIELVPVPATQVVITPEIQKIIQERAHAREQKNWRLADALRDQLRALGVDIQDKK